MYIIGNVTYNKYANPYFDRKAYNFGVTDPFLTILFTGFIWQNSLKVYPAE